MLDLKYLKENFKTSAALLKQRGVDKNSITNVLEQDQKRRALIKQSEEIKVKKKPL